MKKIFYFALILVGIWVQSCTKNPSPSPASTTSYYVASSISPDSTKYSVYYYYDANYNLTGRRTDSVNDTLLYNTTGQVSSVIATFYTKALLGQMDTSYMVYDSKGRIAQINASNRKTGVLFKKNTFTYDANNNLLTDSVFNQLKGNANNVYLGSSNAFTYSGTNVTKMILTYAPGHLKYFAGTAPDSLTEVTNTYVFDSNPNRLNALTNNQKIAVGILTFNANNTVSRMQVGTGKTMNTLYTYNFTNTYTYDPISLLPVTILFTSTGGAQIGPYHLNFLYNKVTKP